jgi:hypothetical protein
MRGASSATGPARRNGQSPHDPLKGLDDEDSQHRTLRGREDQPSGHTGTGCAALDGRGLASVFGSKGCVDLGLRARSLNSPSTHSEAMTSVQNKARQSNRTFTLVRAITLPIVHNRNTFSLKSMHTLHFTAPKSPCGCKPVHTCEMDSSRSHNG